MERSFGLVDDKLAEADFFLEKLEEADFDMFAARCYVSAFMAAARSVTFSLQAVMKTAPNFERWYGKKQGDLKRCSLAKFFHTARNESQHVGINYLSRGSSQLLDDGTKEVKYYFSRGLLESSEGLPNADAVTACTSYMKQLVAIVFDAYAQYGRIIDPEQYYTLENLQTIGVTLEDLEEDLGLPRGSTALSGATDSQRLDLLTRDIPGTEVDVIFDKYLDTNRYREDMVEEPRAWY